jgi:hypothetical protein
MAIRSAVRRVREKRRRRRVSRFCTRVVVGEEELRLEPFAEREVLERACVRHLRHTTFTDISGVGIYRRRGERDRERERVLERLDL